MRALGAPDGGVMGALAGKSWTEIQALANSTTTEEGARCASIARIHLARAHIRTMRTVVSAAYHGWCEAFEETGLAGGYQTKGFIQGSEAWKTSASRRRWVETLDEATVAEAEASPLRRSPPL